MEIDRALSILKPLCDGIDPYTGEVFPQDNIFQQADTTRALFVAIGSLEYSGKREQRKGSLPGNVGKPWSKEEDIILAEEFDKNNSITAIAEIHQRTKGSIQSRLVRLGKITI